jgi:PAS domain S-box-containing protein
MIHAARDFIRAADPRRARVLLADDDRLQLRLNTVRLQYAGYEVLPASGADEALALARRTSPDVIVSDVLMGDFDGFMLCQRVRSDPMFTAVPVVLLSAHCGGAEDRALASHVGAHALVSRTPGFDDELRAVRAALSGKPSTASPSEPPTLLEHHVRASDARASHLLGRARCAEDRYRALFQNAADAVTLLTSDGIVVEANERWRSLLGVDPASMRGRHLGELAPEPDAAAGGLRGAIASGVGRARAVPIQRADGAEIFVDISASIIHLDGEPYVLAMARDVTEEIAAAKKTAESEARYRALLERMPDLIWTKTTDGALCFATPNASRVLGYDAGELTGKREADRLEHIHPADRAAVSGAMREFAESGKPFDVEYRHQRKDGRWTWLRNRSTARYERDGALHLEGVVTDTTERKRLEASLQQAQKMEMVGHLTGGIAHDFNNMLAVILAYSQFIVDDLGPQDPRRADAEEIRGAAQRAAQLTRQLLAFSRRQVLEPRVVDLDATIGGIEKMLRRLIGEDIELAVVPGTAASSVRVDVGQLEQVIVNLAVNARDAMPEGGMLSLETSNVELTADGVDGPTSVPAGGYVMLTVSDTGVGIPAEAKPRLFEPFFTTKGPGKGTGLGLSVCYGIVKQSGGAIVVESEPGVGTVFKIYLPRVAEAPAPVLARSICPRGGGAETLLLVEDDPRIREAVSRTLEPRGYRLLVARDGADGIELARIHEGRIDLVLSDVVMPGSSGPDVVEHVRRRHAGARALLMSGYTDHPALLRGAIDSSVGFLQKPFTPDALARRVREILDA